MAKLLITGDIHGDMNKLYSTIKKSKMESDDVLVILGDFGMIWDGGWERQMRKIERINPGTIFVVLGNHENYDRIEQLPHEYSPKFENEVWVAGRNVYIAYDGGGLYNLLGYKCLVVNGADSIDKENRHIYTSWWPQECLNYRQETVILKAAEEPVDLILSHCSSSTIKGVFFPEYRYESSHMEQFLGIIYMSTIFSEAFFGHYHVDRSYGKYHCLYNTIDVFPEKE